MPKVHEQLVDTQLTYEMVRAWGDELILAARPLIDSYNIKIDPYLYPEDFLGAIKSFRISRRDQKAREGLTKAQVEDQITGFEEAKLIFETADAMGLSNENVPVPSGEYARVVVLGAKPAAAWARALAVQDAMYKGFIQVRHIVFAGSDRKLSDQDKNDLAEILGVEQTSNFSQTESEMMTALAIKFQKDYPNLFDNENIRALSVQGNVGTYEVMHAALEHNDKDMRVITFLQGIYQPFTSQESARAAEDRQLTYPVNVVPIPSDPRQVKKRTDQIYSSEVFRTLQAVVMNFQKGRDKVLIEELATPANIIGRFLVGMFTDPQDRSKAREGYEKVRDSFGNWAGSIAVRPLPQITQAVYSPDCGLMV